MRGWTEVLIGEIARPKQWPILAKAQLVETGYPAFGANGQIGYASAFTHEYRTIAIGCRGSCGSLHITPPKSYLSGNAMALDNLDTKLVHLEYLYWYLAFRGFADVISGSSQPQITGQNLARVKIPLPPLDEQRRIAAILDQADALRRKRREAIDVVAGLKTALFRDMFTLTASASSWPVESLQDVVQPGTIVTYGMVQAGEEFAGGTPYIRTGDIVGGEIATAQLRHADPQIAARFQRARVSSGDIVMSIRATVGTTAIVPAEIDGANLTQGTAKISPGPWTIGGYLLEFLRSSDAQSWISKQVKGATFREITLSRLRELPVVVPPIGLQHDFCKKAAVIDRQLNCKRKSLAQLDALFASLQHRAFRGEL